MLLDDTQPSDLVHEVQCQQTQRVPTFIWRRIVDDNQTKQLVTVSGSVSPNGKSKGLK